jgi:hypothetical protein
MSALTATTNLELSPSVTAERVGNELILLNMQTEQYLAVSPIGARIWELLQANCVIGAVVDALCADYSVARERVQTDVDAFCNRLLELGLAQPTSG